MNLRNFHSGGRLLMKISAAVLFCTQLASYKLSCSLLCPCSSVSRLRTTHVFMALLCAPCNVSPLDALCFVNFCAHAVMCARCCVNFCAPSCTRCYALQCARCYVLPCARAVMYAPKCALLLSLLRSTIFYSYEII